MADGKPTNEPNNYFAFGKQSNKDTEATTFFFTKHLDGTGYDADIEIESVREGGDGQEVGLRYKTLIKGDGQLVSNARSGVLARLLHGALGGDAVVAGGTAGVAGGPVASMNRHTLSPQASLPYFTVEQRHADNLERSAANQWTSLEISGEAGKPWSLSAQFVNGGTMTYRDVGSALTVTRESGEPIYYPYGSYSFDGAASYSADVTKWKVEISRSVDDAIQTTGLSRADVIPLNFDVNVDATIKYTSKDFYRKVVYNGGSVVVAELATGSLNLAQWGKAGLLTAASALSRINVPLLQWTDAKVNKLDPDGKTVYLDVVGMSIKHASHAIFAEVDNTDTADYDV